MKKLEIEGMSCTHCTASVAEALAKVPGVNGVAVSLDDKVATFSSDGTADEEQIKKAVTAIGFSVGNLTDI